MNKTSDNGYFITSPDHKLVSIEKAHFCTWKLQDGLEFLEVGMLVQLNESFLNGLRQKQHDTCLVFNVFVPWFDKDSSLGCLFQVLRNQENAKFVFNEQVHHQDSFFNGGSTVRGVLFSFGNEKAQPFSLLPVDLAPASKIPHTISAKVVFPSKTDDLQKVGNRIYSRFFVKPKSLSIPWKHGGIAKTTFSYDIKVNEPRNAPEDFPLDQIVDIRACYCLHIVPAAFECALQDRVAFKSIRTLESAESVAYTKDIPEIRTKIQPGECLVVFNKLEAKDKQKSPFSFFTVFSMERIGPSQLALAIGANIVCSLLSGWWRFAAFAVFSVVVIVAWIRSDRGHR